MNDYLLFDLDGTLTDPKIGITTCVQYALASFGIEEPDLDKLEPFIGPPLKESFMEFYNLTEEQAVKAVEKYRERFKDTGIFENKVYDGIPQLLKNLRIKHKRLAIASSKPTEFVERILTHFNIREYFEIVLGSEMDGRRTKKEDVVEEVLKTFYKVESLEYDETTEEGKKLKSQMENTMMIGDRRFDVEGAKCFGIQSVAVSYGYGTMEELKEAKPDYIVRTVAELEKVLLRGTNDKKNEPILAKIWEIIFPILIFYILSQVGFYIGQYIAITVDSVLTAGAGGIFVLKDEAGALTALTGNGSALVMSIAYLCAGLAVWRIGKKEILASDAEARLKHSRPVDIASYLFMAVSTAGFALGLNVLYELSGLTNKSQVFQDTATLQYAAIIPMGILVNVIAAPLAEELLFRGMVFGRLKNYMKFIPAMILSAFFFGVYHQNSVQGSYAFLMGCLFVFFYEAFGKLYIAIAVHMISNLVAYTLTMTGMFHGGLMNWSVCALAFAIAIGSLYLFYVKSRVK